MKRIALKQFVFAVLAGLSLPALAIQVTGPQNGPYVPPRHRPPPGYPAPPRYPAPPPSRPMPPRPMPPRPPDYGYQQPRTVYLNRPFVNQLVPLRQWMGLDRGCEGLPIDHVEVRLIGQRSYDAELVLLINGYMEDRLRPYSYSNSLIVRGYKRLGWEVGALELWIAGQVFVESITVYFAR